MTVAHIVPQIALVVGAAVALMLAVTLPRRRQWLAAPVAAASLGVAAVAQIDLARGPQQLSFEGLWALDGVLAWATVAVLLAALLAVALGPEWLRTDPRHAEYYALLLLSTLGAVIMAGAADLLELVAAVLLSSITGYVLAAYHRADPLSVEAGIKFFLIGGLTNVALVLGAVLTYGATGATDYGLIAERSAAGDPTVLVAATVLLTVGVAFKLGAVPAHPWVPDVAQGAPLPSAAFLTVVPKLGALVALARLVDILPSDLVGWRPLMALLAATTMTLGNLAALWQDDVRRLLGWSSVSQSGYGLMALVALGRSELAVPSMLLFLFAYALANTGAFAVVTELRGRTAIGDYAGLGRSRPWLGAGLTVALLSLVGIPPLIGFTAKLNLFAAAVDASYGWLAVLAVLNTVVSLFYYLRVVAAMYLVPGRVRVPLLGRWAAVAVGVAVLGTVVAGLAADVLLARFSDAALLP